MKIGLIGRGYVGSAVERLFAPRHDLVSWDVADESDRPDAELEACDVVVVCVGTPQGADGQLDTSSVTEVVASLSTPRFLVKSTVPPGTIDALAASGKEVCYWPEYVGQSSYHNPYFPSEIAEVPFVILGGEPPITRWCLELLQPLLGPTKTYYRCTAVEAEVIKLTENAFFATKVTFVNEIKRICDAVGADWDTVREGWLLDPRVERMHTLVFPDAPGFGGACLPKDVSGLVAAARDAGYGPDFLAEVLASNERFRA
jgi:UDPglucose 6-dehydrogenase